MKTPTLETPRLLLRRLELADAEQIQAIFPHWEVVRFLAEIWEITADEWRARRHG